MNGDIKNRVSSPERIKLADDISVTPEVIDYCLKKFRRHQRRLSTLEKYYQNETAIQGRGMEDRKSQTTNIHSFANISPK